jgi:hypothetical protein
LTTESACAAPSGTSVSTAAVIQNSRIAGAWFELLQFLRQLVRKILSSITATGNPHQPSDGLKGQKKIAQGKRLVAP